MTWNAPASNNATVIGYRATASPGPATCGTDGATTCVLGGTPGVAYTVTVVALSAGGSSEPSAPSGSAVPSTPVVSATPPVTNLPLDTGAGPISSAAPGQTIVLKGSGYAPFSTVTLAIYSSPRVLGTVTADAAGAFEKSVTVPAGLPVGSHSLVAAGVGTNGKPRALRLDVTVAPTGGTLPVTGPALIWLFVGGFVLIITGVAMRTVRR